MPESFIGRSFDIGPPQNGHGFSLGSLIYSSFLISVMMLSSLAILFAAKKAHPQNPMTHPINSPMMKFMSVLHRDGDATDAIAEFVM